MKTSKKYFEKFKAEFLKWQKELGLMQYRIDFFHEKLDHSYAEIRVQELEKAVRISLNTEISKDSAGVAGGPEEHARHEAMHLLLHRLRWLGGCRYIESTDLDEEWEAIVVRLEKVLGCELINLCPRYNK